MQLVVTEFRLVIRSSVGASTDHYADVATRFQLVHTRVPTCSDCWVLNGLNYICYDCVLTEFLMIQTMVHTVCLGFAGSLTRFLTNSDWG